MRNRRKLIALTTLTILVLIAVSSNAEAKENSHFTPCQYKASYRYYMEKGEGYLKDNQLESALLSYERALIIQPNSEEAQLKIISVKEMIGGKKPAHVMQERTKALRRAIAFAEEVPEEERPSRQVVSSVSEEVYKPRPKRVYKPAPEHKLTPEPSTKEELSQPQQYPKRAATKEAVKQYPRPETVEKKPAKVERSAPKPDPSKKYPASIEECGEPEPEIDLAQKYPSAAPCEPCVEEAGPCEVPYFDAFSDGINSKIQQWGDSANSAIAPSRIRGKYRIAFGATEDDFEWKNANADYHSFSDDTSWRYVFGRNRHNSYDPEIYSRLQVEIDNPITDSLSTYNEIVIDPWTFVGRKRMFVTGSNGDNVEMDLKYWSNVRRTINESYRTTTGDILNIQENKVIDGKLSSQSYGGSAGFGSNRFQVADHEIDRMYVPLRKSWIEYDKEPYRAKLFFMSNQDEALTSDDPMGLSNRRVYWEQSPWLDRYDQSRVFERNGTSAPAGFDRTTEPTKKGQWLSSQSFMARDSEAERLTFLRGASFNAEFENGASVQAVAATPRNLWDTYDQATSLPAAIRAKAPLTDKLDIGGLYTLKMGFRHNSAEAFNNLFAIDASYELFPRTDLIAEGAVSHMSVEEAIGYKNEYTGYGAMLGIRNQGPMKIMGPLDRYELEAKFTHMDDKFFPALSNYRLTRKEFDYSKHIYFGDLTGEDEALKVGDGVDVGRNAFGITLKTFFPDANSEARFDARTVHEDGGAFIENVFRGETTHILTPKLTAKLLGYYQHLGKTERHVDPFINAKSAYSAFTDYFSYEDTWLENTIIQAGEDPSIGSFSGGLQYDFTDYFTGMGIYESTNDPKDMPRGLLNDTYITDEYRDGVIWDKLVPFLYDQGFFDLPPYDYYNVFKTRFAYKPFDPVTVALKYVWNDNKYAMAIDDFATSHGIELGYEPCTNIKLGLLYQYTRQRDLHKDLDASDHGYHFDGHHNIFAAMDYELNEDQHLRIMYGDYVGYGNPYPNGYDDMAALDTRHIVRVVYTGDWGGADKSSRDSSLMPTRNELGPLRPDIPGAKFVTSLYAGGVQYQARGKAADIESDWDSYIGKIEFGLDAYDKEAIEGSLRVGLFTTMEDTEKWSLSGAEEYQANDMDLRGADVNLNVGWAINDPGKYISFTPLVNAGYRRIEFERANSIALGASPTQIGEVDQHFNVSFAGIGGRLDLAFAEPLNFYGSGYWAPLVYAHINNDELGRFDCNKGVVWHAEGGCEYNVSDRFDISLGGFWDLQSLDRTERIDAGILSSEIPDNKLQTYGVKLGGFYKF